MGNSFNKVEKIFKFRLELKGLQLINNNNNKATNQ